MVIEDMQYMTVLNDMAKELEENVVQYNRKASGVKDRVQLIDLREEQNRVLHDILRKHQRILLFMQGKPYPTEAHHAEAVLLPTFGGAIG